MKNLKKLTILHSNDMHGDFLAEQNGKSRVLTTSLNTVVEEYLSVNPHLNHHVEGRLVVEA